MEEQLIDNEINETPKDVILGIMRWWEKKRLLFNLIILGVALFAIFTYNREAYESLASIFNEDFFIKSIEYLLFINVCYCAGWGIQILVYYYFKQHSKTKVVDIVLFVFGTLFTSLITYGGYRSYLDLTYCC